MPRKNPERKAFPLWRIQAISKNILEKPGHGNETETKH